MKGLLFLPVFVAVSVLTFSCSKMNCEDAQNVQVGSVDLNTISKSYTPYLTGELLRFSNEQGSEKTFTSEVVVEAYPICVKDLCVPIDPHKTKYCEFYEAHGIRNLLHREDENMLIELVVSTQIYPADEILFYDFFSVNMSEIGPLAKGEYIPFRHFTEPVFDLSKTIMRDPFVKQESVTIFEKEYFDVLHTAEGENMIYLQKNKGVIAIKLNGVFWLLVE